ncbi:hypothetical protein GCM10009087_42760 [Sphingomonas oligophenolica]|uniref:Uncharacterized protein n=1 Tax=Sphingomonas oligophenolica TaxID=301154 RepID=A0ABU9XZF0_9SPHN
MKRVRTAGAGLVAVSVVAIGLLQAMLAAAPLRHQATPVELLLALVAVLAGMCGMAMLIEGAAVFGEDQGPRRG